MKGLQSCIFEYRMKKWILAILLLTACKLWAQTDTVMVNHSRFVLLKKASWFDGQRDTVIVLFRMEASGERKYLLTHVAYRVGYDCNNTYTDIGTYSIIDNQFTFIPDYNQQLTDPIPTQRKQIYQVTSDGKVIEIYDKQLVPWAEGWINTNE